MDAYQRLFGVLYDGELISTYSYLVMQCGFAMLESGMVRSKNAKHIIIKNVANTSMVALGFWAFGYAFAFGAGEHTRNGFIGLDGFLLVDLETFDHWIFEWSFCACAATIASGSLAERTQMRTWCSDGWLRHLGANGVIDFAGGTVVHILGGMVGCVGAWIAGPRLGRFESNHTEETRAVEIPGHASVLAALGTLIIWYCWYGFNTGSTLGLSGDKWEIARRISVVTTLCASSASCTALMWRRITTKHWDINMLLNGILAGLVASTPGCAVLEPWAAVIVGMVTGPILIGSSSLLVKLRLDDPLDATAVHLCSGLWGTFSVSLFASQNHVHQVYGGDKVYGLFMGGGFGQMWVQLVAIIAVSAWSFTISCI